MKKYIETQSENIKGQKEKEELLEKRLKELAEQKEQWKKQLKKLEEFTIVENTFYNKYRLEDMEIVCRGCKPINQNFVQFPKFTNNKNKRCVFWFIPYYTDINKKKDFFNIESEKYLNNYLWIYEPHSSTIEPITNPIINIPFREYLKFTTDENIIRLDSGEAKDFKGYCVLIKVKDENGELTLSHLQDYLVSTNSRMYKDVKYVQLAESVEKGTDARNVLVFGAPGTGKSRWVNDTITERIAKPLVPGKEFNNDEEAEKYKADREKKIKDEIKQCITRVTFYEDYSYENFVGCYKPVSDKENGKVTYEFRPGPFTNVYVNAKKDQERPYYLVIEEINRARAASVFGDMFQLLDRNGNGESEYDIVPDTELAEYLKHALNDGEKPKDGEEPNDKFDGRMKLPQNMYIYATMNSADQGVYPLDSAFKRRWSFVYKSVDEVYKGKDGKAARPIRVKLKGNEKDKEKDKENVNIEWDALRRAINKKLESEHIEEDKLLGYWFLNNTELQQIADNIDSKDTGMPNPMADKLYSYLFQDVVRMNPKKIFNDKFNTMSKLRESVREKFIEEVLNIDFTEIQTVNVTTTSKSTPTKESSAESSTPEKEPVGG